LQELEPRRKKLISVSPYVAKYAELPPEPSIEQRMYDDFTIDLIGGTVNTDTASAENDTGPAHETEEDS
jgi:hypothetical protein